MLAHGYRDALKNDYLEFMKTALLLFVMSNAQKKTRKIHIMSIKIMQVSVTHYLFYLRFSRR